MLYLDSTLSNISNDTKIAQNGVWMKKLWQKQNRGAKKLGAAKKGCEISQSVHCDFFFENFFLNFV